MEVGNKRTPWVSTLVFVCVVLFWVAPFNCFFFPLIWNLPCRWGFLLISTRLPAWFVYCFIYVWFWRLNSGVLWALYWLSYFPNVLIFWTWPNLAITTLLPLEVLYVVCWGGDGLFSQVIFLSFHFLKNMVCTLGPEFQKDKFSVLS